jgi:Drought induced 19 protein (Di19), zinc-binding
MRELIQKVWCDACYQEGAHQVEASHTYTLGIVGGEQRPALKLLELCDTHDKLATELLGLLAGIGQLPELKAKKAVAPPSAPRIQICPACKAEIWGNAMIKHVWDMHRKDERPQYHGVCPTCREVQNNAAGLAAHRRMAHDFSALEDALSGVSETDYPALRAWRRQQAH